MGDRRLKEHDFARMHLPPEFRQACLERVPEAVRPVVARYLARIREMAGKGRGLILHGPAGVGKTSIAALAAMEARSCGFPAYFTTVWGLREGIRTREEFDEELPVLSRCREVDVLVLDGLAAGDAKDMFLGERVLEELVRARASWKRLTFITTQMTRAGFAEALPDLFAAALGPLVLLGVSGPDQRKQAYESCRQDVFGR